MCSEFYSIKKKSTNQHTSTLHFQKERVQIIPQAGRGELLLRLVIWPACNGCAQVPHIGCHGIREPRSPSPPPATTAPASTSPLSDTPAAAVSPLPVAAFSSPAVQGKPASSLSPAAAPFFPGRSSVGRSKLHRWSEIFPEDHELSGSEGSPSPYRDALLGVPTSGTVAGSDATPMRPGSEVGGGGESSDAAGPGRRRRRGKRRGRRRPRPAVVVGRQAPPAGSSAPVTRASVHLRLGPSAPCRSRYLSPNGEG
ncbi:hypothetical protein BS78_04G046100 [Paspalum vaginatum]|nr:hypothetical protein BS78_04G046100 [Paspalum vaginatum]